MSVKPKIIIIGAGAAGIAAATRLLENGLIDITVLEAENRIGGRINSVDFDGSIVDLGGQWCHGEKGNIVYDLVKDLNVLSTSHNNYQDNTYYLSNGVILDKSITDRLCKIAFNIIENTENVEDGSMPFGDYFTAQYNKKVINEFGNNTRISYMAKILLEWFHKFFNCLDATKSWNEVSVRGTNQFQHCEGDFQLNWKNKGFITILNVLMKKVPDITKQLPIDDKIFLNKEVSKIVWDNNNINSGGVTIDCSDGSSYNADHVIITVSLGVLKNLYKTAFVPELPNFKQNVIEGMSYGTVNKILIKFPTKWWPDDFKGFSLVWIEEDKKNVLKDFTEGPLVDGRSWLEDIYGFYVIDSHPRVLLGWVVGKTAEIFESFSEDCVFFGCMFLLKKFAGKKYNIPMPDSIIRSKWNSNPHFCGSYVHSSIEAEKKNAFAEDLAKPVIASNSKQVLLFAGEGTHSTFFSTVHGAIETGHREADRIINIYKDTKEKYYKVAIIGAGMAGLSAARTLLDLGHRDIIILEAQHNPGGRINTIEWGNGVLELGAQWIHGKLNSLYQIAEKHDLIAEKTSEEGLGIYVRDNGEIINDFIVKRVDFEIGNILEKCKEFLNTSDYPKSVGDFVENQFLEYLENSGDPQDIKQIKLELFDWHRRFQIIDNSCLNLKKLSAKSWGQYVCQEDRAHVNLKKGYKSLVDVIVNGFPENILSLSSAVTHIETNRLIKLKCQNGLVISCDHLILTLSLGCLKEFSNISPALPQPLNQSIKDMGFYGIGKIFLIFDYNWWNVDGIQLVWQKNTILNDEEKWLRHITGFDPVFNQPNTLLGWVGGEGVKIMENFSEEKVGIHCMKLLRRFIAYCRIPDPVKVIRTSWCSNPWIKGGYCHITPNCDSSGSGIHKLSEPVFVDGKLRILLAGEAIHPSHFSTTHGAYESGQRQAMVLHKYLSGNSKL